MRKKYIFYIRYQINIIKRLYIRLGTLSTKKKLAIR